MVTKTLYARQKKRQRYIEQTFGLYGRRQGWDDLREQHQNLYIIKCETLPVQVGCMRQVCRAGALGWPRGMGWEGRWEGGSGWGTHVNPWQIHVNVWQKPLQYCKVISLQLIKINGKKKYFFLGLLDLPLKRKRFVWTSSFHKELTSDGESPPQRVPVAAVLSCMVLTFIFREVMKDGEKLWGAGMPSGEKLGCWILREIFHWIWIHGTWTLTQSGNQMDGTQSGAHTISVLKGRTLATFIVLFLFFHFFFFFFRSN